MEPSEFLKFEHSCCESVDSFALYSGQISVHYVCKMDVKAAIYNVLG